MAKDFIVEDDYSKRYFKSNKSEPTIEEYVFGCEFEFYLNDWSDYSKVVDELLYISKADLLANDLTRPNCSDSNECMHLKPDESLDDGGLEISIPKSTYSELIIYIKAINNLIDRYGYTDNSTGFHIHISTSKISGVNLNFFKFALLCNQNDLLHYWEQRNEYCLNVMDIFNAFRPKESKKIKNKKGKVWNLELISPNRIEIRTIGGKDYHKKSNKILAQIELFRDTFIETLYEDTLEYKDIEKLHLEKIKNASDELKKQFIEMIKPKKM